MTITQTKNENFRCTIKEELSDLNRPTKSGSLVKDIKCLNEVSNDNKDEKEVELFGRFQAGCRGTAYRAGVQAH